MIIGIWEVFVISFRLFGKWIIISFRFTFYLRSNLNNLNYKNLCSLYYVVYKYKKRTDQTLLFSI